MPTFKIVRTFIFTLTILCITIGQDYRFGELNLLKENTDVTVIFSGEGSDEASGSYMYFHNAPSKDIFGMTEGERVKHIWGSIKFKNSSTISLNFFLFERNSSVYLSLIHI